MRNPSWSTTWSPSPGPSARANSTDPLPRNTRIQASGLNRLAAWWDRRRISIARSVNSITVSSSCHTLGGVKRAAAVMLAVAALSATGCRRETQSDSGDGAHVSVVSVTGIADGDTIHVLLNGRRERLRLIGLDAPEIAHPDIAAECYGTTSARFTQRSLEGRRVRLEFDV